MFVIASARSGRVLFVNPARQRLLAEVVRSRPQHPVYATETPCQAGDMLPADARPYHGEALPVVDDRGGIALAMSQDMAQAVALPGKDGKDGKDGAPGQPGLPGKDGVRGADGAQGSPGRDGRDGAPGKDGTAVPAQRAGVFATSPCDAVGNATVAFAPPFAAPPQAVVPVPVYVGDMRYEAVPSAVTANGCKVILKRSRGALLLSTGPFETAPAGSVGAVLAIGV